MTTAIRQPQSAESAAGPVSFLDGEVPGLPIILDLRPLLGGKSLAEIDFELLWAFIEANDLYAIEYNETGELIIMPPMMMPGGKEEATLIAFAAMWSLEHGGLAASSKTVFRIPNLWPGRARPRCVLGIPGAFGPARPGAVPHRPDLPRFRRRDSLTQRLGSPTCNARCQSTWLTARAWAG